LYNQPANIQKSNRITISHPEIREAYFNF